MSNQTMQELIEWCKYYLYEKETEIPYVNIMIDPSTERCLKNVSMAEFREKLKPHHMVVYYIEKPLLKGYNWFVYKEEHEDIGGWLKSKRDDI